MVIRTIYLFLVYFVCVNHFIHCTPHCFFLLYCNVFRERLTFHCMSISSKKSYCMRILRPKLLNGYSEQNLDGKIRAKWTKHDVY